MNSKVDAFIRPIARRLHARLLPPIAQRLQANHMSLLGIANTMRLAYFYNLLKFGRHNNWRRPCISSTSYPAQGKRQTELPADRNERGLGSRHLNVAPPISIEYWRIRTGSSPNVLESGVRPRALIEAIFKRLDIGGEGGYADHSFSHNLTGGG
jgi:hypothetical protein